MITLCVLKKPLHFFVLLSLCAFVPLCLSAYVKPCWWLRLSQPLLTRPWGPGFIGWINKRKFVLSLNLDKMFL